MLMSQRRMQIAAMTFEVRVRVRVRIRVRVRVQRDTPMLIPLKRVSAKLRPIKKGFF